MAILPVLQLPRYQGSDPSILQCIKVLNASLSRKQSLAVLRLNCERERGVASLENCLEKWKTKTKIISKTVIGGITN